MWVLNFVVLYFMHNYYNVWQTPLTSVTSPVLASHFSFCTVLVFIDIMLGCSAARWRYLSKAIAIDEAHAIAVCSSRHTVVCQRPRKQKKTCGTQVLFTGTVKLPNSAFCISKTTKPISTKFIFFALHIYIYYFTYQNWRKLL